MASYCAHCGNPSPDEARFCMKCGREQLPAPAVPTMPAAPPVPAPSPAAPAGAPLAPPPPPPPAYVPGPVPPSPVGAFFGRALRGDWLSSAKAAAWPAGLLLVLATVLAIPSYGQDDDVVVGWSDRLRIALAMLLQGFGGGFEMKAAEGPSQFGDSGSSGFSGGVSSDDFPGYPGGSDATFSDSPDMDAMAQGAASLSLVPLTVTVLFIVALYLGARMLRTRGAGLEAAIRISLLVTGAVLVLGLFAQPDIAGVEISSSPLLAALGALAISLAVTAGVLQRDDLAAWLAQRPAARSTVRAVGTSVRALGVVVALCSLVGLIVYANANAEDVDGTALLIALPILPNIGLAVLGLSWGVPVKYDIEGRFSVVGSSAEHGRFGLSEISDVWGGGAVAGCLALGVVCALTLGLWAARRAADGREQLLAGAFSLGLILLFTGVSGVFAEVEGGMADFGGRGTSEFAPSVPDALLFGLLWVGAATFLGPYVLRMAGQRPVVPPAPAPPAYVPGMPVAGFAPAPELGGCSPYAPAGVGGPPPDPQSSNSPRLRPGGPPGADNPASPAIEARGLGQSPQLAPAPYEPPAGTGDGKRKVLVWTATLTAAFAIGGGATAGVLMLQDKDTSDTAQDKQPAASQSDTPSAVPSASPSPSPSDSPATTPSASASPSSTPAVGEPTLPAGFVLKQDPAGFSVGVMDGWQRRQAGSQVFYEAPTGGSYLQIGVIKNTPMTSYENFLGLERKHLETPETEYERKQLTQNTFQGRPGALWEFTHVPEPDEGRLVRHVIDQAFVAADGTEYAILAAGRADYWDPDKDVVFSTATSSFKVSG